MGKIRRWIRKTFGLKKPDADLRWAAETETMRKIVLRIMQDEEVTPNPAVGMVRPEALAAMVAAGYSILRRDADDWRALEMKDAMRLYIDVAACLLNMAYGEGESPLFRGFKEEEDEEAEK